MTSTSDILKSRDKIRDACKSAAYTLDKAMTDFFDFHMEGCEVIGKDDWDYHDCTCWQNAAYRASKELRQAFTEF
jgi:hypothetical protein